MDSENNNKKCICPKVISTSKKKKNKKSFLLAQRGGSNGYRIICPIHGKYKPQMPQFMPGVFKVADDKNEQ